MQHFRPGTVSDYRSLSGRTCAEMSEQELIRPLSMPSIFQLDLERTVSASMPVPAILKDLDTACALLEANAPSLKTLISVERLRRLRGKRRENSRLDILLTLKGEDSYRVYTASLYGSPRWVPVAGGITAPLAWQAIRDKSIPWPRMAEMPRARMFVAPTMSALAA
jgi:hypothetical protein